MKKFLVGIDGGGSNTKLLLTDINLNILETSIGGPSNFLKIGLDSASRNVYELVIPFIHKYKESRFYIVIGTAGAGRKNDADEFEFNLKKYFYQNAVVKVVSDAGITLKGAFENEDGAILIAGTGSILYYKSDKVVNRVGGFGRLIGDEGSGYSIGRKGLNTLAKILDGRLHSSPLMNLAEEKFEINSQELLITKVYKESFNIASFSEVVIEAAIQGDKYSLDIIKEEAEELFNHITTLIRKENLTELNLVLTGGLLSNDNIFKSTLINKINKELPQVEVVNPKHSPEYGAVLIAKEIITEKNGN
ncbi:MAG TPA: hypothetical protein ENN33_00120 [Ignavibacteria bacterium]|nr:hypothetical protein [Ignavibacteria bacterium]